MNYRNLRHLLRRWDDASPFVMSADGEGDTGGGGGAPAPAEPAAGGDPPAPAGEGDPPAPAADPAPPAAGPAGEEPPAPPTRVPWQNKRIDALTATAKAEKERADAAAAEAADAKRQLDAYRALYGTDAPAPGAAPAAPAAAPATGGAFTQEDVQREAQRIAGIQRLNERCDAMFTAGKAAHGDAFVDACKAAGDAFGQDLAGRVDFFDAITTLPNGADVYAKLAGDLDHFADVLAMTPLQLGMELARLSTTTTKKAPTVSKVPAPIEPIDGSGGGDFNPDTASMDEYEKNFEARRAARAAR